MVISIFSNYQQQQISVYAQQVVKILRRSDGGKSIKMPFKNVRYSAQKTVSNHLKGTFTQAIFVAATQCNSMQFLSRRSCNQLRFHCDFSAICQCKRQYTSIA